MSEGGHVLRTSNTNLISKYLIYTTSFQPAFILYTPARTPALPSLPTSYSSYINDDYRRAADWRLPCHAGAMLKIKKMGIVQQ